ncbi:MAG: signal peptidase II, partial [Lentisphaeria bacterium]|nr:signal peptidase II [Lentisphaeria bacterium]
MRFSPLNAIGKPVERKDLKVFLLAVLTCFVMLGLDQLTKYYVVCRIPFHARIPVINGFFDLTHITNTGAAWGILAGRMWLLLAISGLVFAGAIVFM